MNIIFSTGQAIPPLNLDFSAIQVPSASTSSRGAGSSRNAGNPDQLALLKQNNPRLADALLSQDLGKQYSIFFSKHLNIFSDIF